MRRSLAVLALLLFVSGSVLAKGKKDDEEDDDWDAEERDTPWPAVPGYSRKPVRGAAIERTPVPVPSPAPALTQADAEAAAFEVMLEKSGERSDDPPDFRELVIYEIDFVRHFNRPAWKVRVVGRVPHGCADFTLFIDAENRNILQKRGDWWQADRDYEDDCIAIARGDPDPRDAVMDAAEAELRARGFTALVLDRDHVFRPADVWEIGYSAKKNRRTVKVLVRVDAKTNKVLEVVEPSRQR